MATKQKVSYIIGLGNKDQQYARTYHNIGHFFSAQFERLNSQEENPKLIQVFTPEGFMNQIGTPVAKFIKDKEASPNQILVIHDDSDQAIGQYKFVFAGGSGGHKGVESLIKNLKTNEFHRLKVGIRPEKEIARKKAGDFVLKKWSQAQEKIFFALAQKAWQDPKNPIFS